MRARDAVKVTKTFVLWFQTLAIIFCKLFIGGCRVPRSKIVLLHFHFILFCRNSEPKVNLSHCGDKPVNIVSASKYEAMFPYLFQFSYSCGGTSCRATASCPGEPSSNPFLAFTKNPIHLFLRSIELFLKHMSLNGPYSSFFFPVSYHLKIVQKNLSIVVN